MKRLKDMNETEMYHYLNGVAQNISDQLPPGPSPQGKCIFFLLMTDAEESPSPCQYVSNIEREYAVKVLRETADRLEKKLDNPRGPWKDLTDGFSWR